MSDTIATPAARVADTELMETKTMTDAPSETGVKRKLKADLIVIGGGSGGLSAAAGAAMLGLNVILYEKHVMGGDCLNYGCVPSKALLTTAKYAQTARESAKYGVSVSAPTVDWEAVKAHVQKAIDTIAPVDSQERFEGLGVTVIREHARFKDRKTIESATTEATARRIIVSTRNRLTTLIRVMVDPRWRWSCGPGITRRNWVSSWSSSGRPGSTGRFSPPVRRCSLP